MAERTAGRESIRRRLLMFLVPALLLLVAAAAVLSYVVALRVAISVYDRSLLDPVLDMAENVRNGAAGPQLDMLAQAQEALLYDSEDTLVFQIRDAAGKIIAGAPDLGPPPTLAPGQRMFFDGANGGQPLRIAAAKSDSGVLVQVGETLNKRRQLVWEILAAEFVPTLLIALASLGLAWTVVAHGMAPLGRVRADILGRAPHDLRPLDERTAPAEIAPAVEAFNRLLAQLRESSAMQQRFLANAAHQLRTPLAGLQMHLELLLQRDLAPEVRREIESMYATTLRAGHLANQLLVLAKADASADQPGRARAVHLPAIADAAVHEWVPRAIARDIDLGFELQESVVTGDASLLSEVLGNLIDNALRYTPPGGSVTVRCGYEDGAPCLAVEDSGPGIPEWARERVFERFFRVEGSAGDGAGLGLAIVKEVAERHAHRHRISHPPAGARHGSRSHADTVVTSGLEQLDAAAVGHADAIADAQPRRRALIDGRPRAVVVLDADLVDHLRLRFLDLIADVRAAEGADNGRDGAARAATDEAAEAATRESADDEARSARLRLFDHLAHRFDRAHTSNRGLSHLIRRLRAAPGYAERGGRQHRRPKHACPGEETSHHPCHGLPPFYSGIEFSRYIATSNPVGRPSLPSHLAKIGSISPER
jgi:two-component system sensor histidine kinase TctE